MNVSERTVGMQVQGFVARTEGLIIPWSAVRVRPGLLEDDAFFLTAKSSFNGVGFGRPDGGMSEEKSEES